MKRLPTLVQFAICSAWLFTACSPEQHYLQGGNGIGGGNGGGGGGEIVIIGGDETRGGGDGCEMSFKHHLGEALAWLGTQENAMRPEDWAKTQAALFSGKLDALQSGRIDCECVDKPIIIDGIAKTAGTKKLSHSAQPDLPRFHSEIDQSRWFKQPLRIRTALACHEALVMAGVEKTGKDDFCRRLLKAETGTPTIEKIECTQNLNAWDLLKVTATNTAGTAQGLINLKLELRTRRENPLAWQELAQAAANFTFNEELAAICWFSSEGDLGIECNQVTDESILMKHFFNGNGGNPFLQFGSEKIIANWFNLAPILAETSTSLMNIISASPVNPPLAMAAQADYSECKIQYFTPTSEHNAE